MAAAIITRIRVDTCVGVDAHIAPAAQAAFTEILGEFVALQRGDVGIAPYEKYAEYGFLFAKGIRNHFLSRKMCGFSAP